MFQASLRGIAIYANCHNAFWFHTLGHDMTNETVSSNLTCSSCEAIFDVVQKLLLRLNVTTPCCLGDNSTCSDHVDPENPEERTDPAKGMCVWESMIHQIATLTMAFWRYRTMLHLFKFLSVKVILLGRRQGVQYIIYALPFSHPYSHCLHIHILTHMHSCIHKHTHTPAL